MIKNARRLECNHCFHLICLSKWIENGNRGCPLCRKDINFVDIAEEPVWTFRLRLNTTLFSWLPNITLGIIRGNRNQSN